MGLSQRGRWIEMGEENGGLIMIYRLDNGPAVD